VAIVSSFWLLRVSLAGFFVLLDSSFQVFLLYTYYVLKGALRF
jgi:hypothetical protein